MNFTGTIFEMTFSSILSCSQHCNQIKARLYPFFLFEFKKVIEIYKSETKLIKVEDMLKNRFLPNIFNINMHNKESAKFKPTTKKKTVFEVE